MASRALDVDPFPTIPCALLHSGDVRRYALHGSPDQQLFQPFDPAKLKSASYEISFEGSAFRWGPGNTELQEKVLTPGTTFEVPRNSIVFIRPKVKFRIPDYLALRFNLHIQLVHRGLLLGTGPLVDPGFEGQLLIPIHNLTDTPLQVNAEDGFIWIEVTKVSPLQTGAPPSDNPDYAVFPPSKKNQLSWEYFKKANKNEPIRSSLPSLQTQVDDATKYVRTKISRLQIAASVGFLIAVVPIGISLVQLVESTKQLVVSTQQIVQDSHSKMADELRKVSDKVDVLDTTKDALNRSLPMEIRELTERVNALEKRLATQTNLPRSAPSPAEKKTN